MLTRMRCVFVAIVAVLMMGAKADYAELRARPAGEFPRVTPLAGTESRAAWEKRRVELRREWEQVMGAMPAAAERVPLATEVVSTENLSDHTRVLLRYSIDAK